MRPAQACVDIAGALDDSAPRSGKGSRRAIAPGALSVMLNGKYC
jgi:hypothetical protein